jgi:hypothetical protein
MATLNPSKVGPKSGQRRSQRVILSVAITVRAEGDRGASFEEETHTMVVNAHGALIGLIHKVEKGQKLRLTNRATKTELDCQVTYLGPLAGNKAQIGVEFIKPSPHFWHIAFPPEDWTIPEQTPAATNDKSS